MVLHFSESVTLITPDTLYISSPTSFAPVPVSAPLELDLGHLLRQLGGGVIARKAIRVLLIAPAPDDHRSKIAPPAKSIRFFVYQWYRIFCNSFCSSPKSHPLCWLPPFDCSYCIVQNAQDMRSPSASRGGPAIPPRVRVLSSPFLASLHSSRKRLKARQPRAKSCE